MGEYDVIVVGAGIIGLATAYHIKRLSPGTKLVIVDMMRSPGSGDTSKSAGCYRTIFSSTTNYILSKSTIEFYKSIEAQGHDLRIMEIGYLILGSTDRLRTIENFARKLNIAYENVEKKLLNKLGIVTNPDEELSLEPIDGGVLIREAGILSVDKLVEFYVSMLRRMGVEFLLGVRVKRLLLEPLKPLGIEGEPFPWQDVKVTGIELDTGKILKAREKVILAIGAWTCELLDPVGIGVPVKPKKRQVFVIGAETAELREFMNTPNFNPYKILPVTILPRGIYLRPEPSEQAFWIGMSDHIGRPYRLEPTPQAESEFFIYGIYPVLSKYIPKFENLMPKASWAGHYDVSLVDGVPIVHEEEEVIIITGTSGSGIMKADALGRIAAHMYLGDTYAQLHKGFKIKVSDLGLKRRSVEPETLII